jgi:hypothetical protein
MNFQWKFRSILNNFSTRGWNQCNVDINTNINKGFIAPQFCDESCGRESNVRLWVANYTFFPHSSVLLPKRAGCSSYIIFYRNNVFQQSDNIIVQDGQKVHSILESLSLLPYNPNVTTQDFGPQGMRSLLIFSQEPIGHECDVQQQNPNSILFHFSKFPPL